MKSSLFWLEFVSWFFLPLLGHSRNRAGPKRPLGLGFLLSYDRSQRYLLKAEVRAFKSFSCSEVICLSENLSCKSLKKIPLMPEWIHYSMRIRIICTLFFPVWLKVLYRTGSNAKPVPRRIPEVVAIPESMERFPSW